MKALSAAKDATSRQSINQGLRPEDYVFFTWSYPLHAWEVYSVIVHEILSTVLYGLIAIFAVTLMFVPHPLGAFLVTPMVAAIYVELMAGLQIAGLYINVITAVALIMTIGLVVDYTIHVILAYFDAASNNDHQSPNERIQQVLVTMGQLVLLGGLSTFLGVLILAFSASTLFKTFFVTIFLIVVLGIGHGLVFMPVVLSLIGQLHNRKEKSYDHDLGDNTAISEDNHEQGSASQI